MFTKGLCSDIQTGRLQIIDKNGIHYNWSNWDQRQKPIAFSFLYTLAYQNEVLP